MAKHASNTLDYILQTTKPNLQALSQIRHFSNLKVAFDGQNIWIRGFSLEQIDSPEVNTLPAITIYYIKDNLLFPKGSLLPQTKIPSRLLWSTIQQAFVLEEPSINPNYFGIHDTISPKIVLSKIEQQTVAILAEINSKTIQIIESTGAYRFQNLKYTLINNDKILIIGTPLLPIQGDSYWLDKDFLFPNGYQLEFPILNESIKQIINPNNKYYVLWQKDNNYSLIPKSNCVPLSISSFRLTLSSLNL